MSRLSIRPRPLDFNKKLPIVKSVKDFEDDESSTSTRNSQILRLAAEVDNEIQQVPSKKVASEIPTPEFVVVDTYERDYSRTFAQPTSYIRARGARSEIGEFVEYDLDNEDEDWLHEFNRERKSLSTEKFETVIFKLEVLDHKARERAGTIIPTSGPPIHAILTFDAALEALQSFSIQYGVFQSIYNYWKGKRDRWQKPILRRLQPPPPANDTNPYNVFRPREKAHRLHTRRMQRRENNLQSFEKLRQVRRNLEQTKTIMQALLLREEKKRYIVESEIALQRIQLKYRNETELLEDSLAVPGLPSFPSKVSSEDEFVDSDDVGNSTLQMQPLLGRSMPIRDSKQDMLPSGKLRHELRGQNGWLQKMVHIKPGVSLEANSLSLGIEDLDNPIMLFTKPIDPQKLAAAGIVPPSEPTTTPDNESMRSSGLRGRFGRGGRIIFDRCNILMNNPQDYK